MLIEYVQVFNSLHNREGSSSVYIIFSQVDDRLGWFVNTARQPNLDRADSSRPARRCAIRDGR